MSQSSQPLATCRRRRVYTARRRSIEGWWWRLGFALFCTLLCVYIVFDVLDVDGSDFQKRLGVEVVATATTQAEAEHLCRLDLSPSEPWVRPLPRGACDIPFDTLRLGSVASQGVALVWRSPALPRKQLSRVALTAHTPSADPA
jgi:hypothetical protein